MTQPVETWTEAMITAHRHLPRADEPVIATHLRDIMTKLRDEHGVQRVTSGMATGGDTAWARAAKDLGMPLRAALPYPRQSLDGVDGRPGQRWTKKQQADWDELVQYARDTGGAHVVSGGEDPTTFDTRVRMLHERNDWMLANNEVVVGVWAPANLRSGTASCLRKAVSAGKPVILLNLARRHQDPARFLVRRPSREWWADAFKAPLAVKTA